MNIISNSAEVSESGLGSVGPGRDPGLRWREIDPGEFRQWDLKLRETDCHYQQFPFWAQAHSLQGYSPKFFYYGDPEKPTAFTAVVEVPSFPFRCGLIDRGPFFFDPHSADVSKCIADLISLANDRGYVFLRFTRGQADVFAHIRAVDSATPADPYPFCRDPRNSLAVELAAKEDDMLAGFNATARRKIRKGLAAGYNIRTADNDVDFEEAWRLFENLASKKRFQLSSKPKSVWREALKLGGANGFARLYLCFAEDKLVAAQLIICGGSTCEATLSALDVDALAGRPSPAALLVWRAMVDSKNLGCKFFNLGGPGDPKRNNNVSEFKNMFKPVLDVAPEPLQLILRPLSFRIWNDVYLRGWRAWRNKKLSFSRRFAGRNRTEEKERVGSPVPTMVAGTNSAVGNAND